MASLFVILWILCVFVFFSFSQTKLLTYIYPLYPMAAVLIGVWIDNEPTKNARIACGVFFTVVALLVAIFLPGYVARGNGLTSAGPVLDQIGVVFTAAAVLSLIALGPAFEWQKVRRQLVFAIPAISVAAFFSLVALAPTWKEDLPDLAMVKISNYIKATTPPNQTVLAVGLKKPSLVFYASRPIFFVEGPNLALPYLRNPPYPLLAMKVGDGETTLPRLEKYLPATHFKILLHSGLKYVLIKYQSQ